ncbi:hypothetical protein ACO2Q9_09755 [Variovorax sp. VNK109]|uniref:hypothetical protein n=1 Tax=Variovorax sp. VNK109 TaxID=3400919 RepID=UPI003C1229FC
MSKTKHNFTEGLEMTTDINRFQLFNHGGVFVVVAMLLGCASPPPLSEAGARVRAITRDQAKDCRFVRVVQYNQREMTTGKTTTVLKAIGETNIRNAVASHGANAFVLIKEETDWFLGTMDYQAEAFSCP